MNRTVFLTGATGLLGQAVTTRFTGINDVTILPLGRASTGMEWQHAVESSGAGLHFAGVTKAEHPADFWSGNLGPTETVVAAIRQSDRPVPLLYASSIRAIEETDYGQAKRAAENLLLGLAKDVGNPVTILRLPSFFGVWSRPSYNSAVATFCHDVSRGRMPMVRTPDARISLVHVNDIVDTIMSWMIDPAAWSGFIDVNPVHHSTVGRVASIITSFGTGANPHIAETEKALVRGLWQTYQAHRLHIAPPTGDG